MIFFILKTNNIENYLIIEFNFKLKNNKIFVYLSTKFIIIYI